MRIVFWQNCLSPHQLPYIARLMDDARVDEVVVVADEAISDDRKNMGWNVGNYAGLERCRIVMHPEDAEINSLFSQRQEDSWHLFSGIHGFPYLFHCLGISLNYQVKRGMITELPNTFAFGRKNGKPLWLHKLRFFVEDWKYAKRMDKVFAMGKRAVRYFQTVNKGWTVYPFMYCTQPQEGTCFPVGQGPTKFIFVGSLSYWKAPKVLSSGFFSCVKAEKTFDAQLTYVGDGALRPQIEKYIKENKLQNQIALAGYQPQTDVPKWLLKNDVLVLPSVYDGWGAVVNEALQAGLYVVCSDACGASDLLKDERLGKVFHAGDADALATIMAWCHKNINTIREDAAWRRQWAYEHIGGSVLAKYMVDCLCGTKVQNLY